eukprot:scaffold128367_cov69-Phaeocystis_antarctica.AAC.1
MRAACANAALTSSRLLSRFVCPAFDLAGGSSELYTLYVQPAAELRHVQRHKYEGHVSSALRACPGPQPSVGPFPCTPLAPLPPPRPPAPPPPRSTAS